MPRLDLIGGPRTTPHYPRGWAMAGNTPFRLYKINTHAGGHSVPFVVSWPAGLDDAGTLRRQYGHVTDVLPTVLDIVGAERPSSRNGKESPPLVGTTMLPLLTRCRHAERAHRAALRDERPPRLLPRRLGGGDPPPAVHEVHRRRVGALRPRHRSHRARRPRDRAPRPPPRARGGVGRRGVGATRCSRSTRARASSTWIAHRRTRCSRSPSRSRTARRRSSGGDPCSSCGSARSRSPCTSTSPPATRECSWRTATRAPATRSTCSTATSASSTTTVAATSARSTVEPCPRARARCAARCTHPPTACGT